MLLTTPRSSNIWLVYGIILMQNFFIVSTHGATIVFDREPNVDVVSDMLEMQLIEQYESTNLDNGNDLGFQEVKDDIRRIKNPMKMERKSIMDVPRKRESTSLYVSPFIIRRNYFQKAETQKDHPKDQEVIGGTFSRIPFIFKRPMKNLNQKDYMY
ncbi:uncharacterized protein LOC120346808 isoform X1 [Styela clava]